MRHSTRFRKGFTLIELLVVIAIIGLLSSIVLVALGPARARARDARRQSDIKEISTAMELCYDDSACQITYGAGTLTAANKGAGKYATGYTAGANAVTAIGTYLAVVPKDPTDVSPTQYTWLAGSATEYCVYGKLEAPSTATYMAASEKGTRTDLTAAPSALPCW